MVYRVQDEEIESWYASFEKREKWVINQTKGIDKTELIGLIRD